eukprot:TRINITY_DN1633_c0_g2_i3.p1 TRINITY_DN1633_c0_g2~~TRINITY_DN1633_c0_g2_i3.p1  ORF type:complete len:511 (+),score=164.90 TRINITY_DN1633_c0_g2_i3:498-2030(+)
MSEIRIHRSLHQTNIVKFEHFFEDSENVYILLELCQNQTLNELLKRRKRLTELEVRCYLIQLIAGVKYLHAHRVIHRDLKLGNLFLTDRMEVKIGDFGLATKLEFDGDRKRTICGTPNYIAPEIIDGKQGHSYEVDIWSLGVIIYTLIIGKPPFETSDVKTTYRRIKMNAYTFPEHITISSQAKDLITKILNLDPAMRPTLDEILDHAFLHIGSAIPKLLPASTLACPPSSSYTKQFVSGVTETERPRLESTVPLQLASDIKVGSKQALQNTDRVILRTDASKAESKKGANEEEKKEESKKDASREAIWVKKWMDYTSKYGIGYTLTNGTTGVFFNDSTKIVLDVNAHKFHYIEKRHSDRQDIMVTHNLIDYPRELHKKVTLLQHFKNYLENDARGGTGEEAPKQPKNKDEPPVYVKKWTRTRHAIMFRLSNKIVQVCFEDRTEIILDSESREVTYLNKKGGKATYPLSSALESTNAEMTKRLKYTKEILTHMLTGNQPKSSSSKVSINN